MFKFRFNLMTKQKHAASYTMKWNSDLQIEPISRTNLRFAIEILAVFKKLSETAMPKSIHVFLVRLTAAKISVGIDIVTNENQNIVLCLR